MNDHKWMIAGCSPIEMPIDVGATVGGRNLAPVDGWFIPLRVSTIKGDVRVFQSTIFRKL